LGFVDDPSAWIMDIGDIKDLIYCLSIRVPLIIFLMILVSAMVHVVSVGFAPMLSNFLLYSAQLSPFLIQLWTYLAPFLWLLLLGPTIYHGHQKPPDDNDPCGHREKHAKSQFRHHQSRNEIKNLPALLTCSSIAAILDAFVKKHITLTGFLM
jgi:hypothetical protein